MGRGGGRDLVNSQLETHDSLSTTAYSVNIHSKKKEEEERKKNKQTNKMLNKTRQKFMTKISIAGFHCHAIQNRSK